MDDRDGHASDPAGTATAGTGTQVIAYGMSRPTLGEARETLRRIHMSDVDLLWATLLESAGRTTADLESPIPASLIVAMFAADPFTQLAAQALRIRMVTFEHLSTAHVLLVEARRTRPAD